MSIYRLIMIDPVSGLANTGGTYPGCSIENQSACDPQQFANQADAVQYAKDHNEIPVSVATAADAWNVVAGAKQITDDMIIKPSILDTLQSSPLAIGIGAYLLYRLL